MKRAACVVAAAVVVLAPVLGAAAHTTAELVGMLKRAHADGPGWHVRARQFARVDGATERVILEAMRRAWELEVVELPGGTTLREIARYEVWRSGSGALRVEVTDAYQRASDREIRARVSLHAKGFAADAPVGGEGAGRVAFYPELTWEERAALRERVRITNLEIKLSSLPLEAWAYGAEALGAAGDAESYREGDRWVVRSDKLGVAMVMDAGSGRAEEVRIVDVFGAEVRYRAVEWIEVGDGSRPLARRIERWADACGDGPGELFVVDFAAEMSGEEEKAAEGKFMWEKLAPKMFDLRTGQRVQ